MSKLLFRPATAADIEAISDLVNRAYRPLAGAEGWTHEADLVFGDRATPQQVLESIQQENSVIFLALDNAVIEACIHLEIDGDSGHLGLFAVNPQRQGQGLGKQLLAYAEDFASNHYGVKRLVMHVVSARKELIAFYVRCGYQKTGQVMDYIQMAQAGVPKVDGLKVETLEKHQSN